MTESRLIKYIKSLNAREKEQFRQFVISPYFNQHQKTTDLLEIILKNINKQRPKLGKEAVFAALFPDESTYDEQKLYNTMSYLKKLYHRFIAIRHFEEKTFDELSYTIEAAYANNYFDVLRNRSKQMEKALRKHKFRDTDYYLNNYKYNALLGYHNAQYGDRAKSPTFQKMLKSLDRYFILEKLKNTSHLTANMILMNTKYDFWLIDEIIAYLKKHPEEYKEDTSINMYLTILLSLKEEDNPEHYNCLKEMFINNIHELSEDEKGDLYAFANNYCIRQINKGHSIYQRELFQLYKEGLKNELILDNGILSEWNYKNITALGCSLKEFEWTQSFIQDYKAKLPEHRRENAYNYNLAHLYYNKKLYDEALSALLLVQFTDVKYHLNTSFLLLRTYYALWDTEALLSLLETFRIYVIRQQKMTGEQKKGYTNFLRFAKRLVLLNHHATTYSRKELKEKLISLHNQIKDTKNVINRYWLLEESDVGDEKAAY